MSNFTNLAKKTFIYNRKTVLLTLGAILLGSVIFGTAIGLLGRGGGTGEVVCYGIMALLVATATASMAFGDFKTKAGQIDTLMTPATAFEKFAVRWIAVVPMLALLLVAGFYVADLSRIFANGFSEFYVAAPAYHRIVNVYDVVTQYFPDHRGMTVASLLIYYFFWQSLYLLGGILWPKLSFIKTFAIIRLANLVFLPLANKLDIFFTPGSITIPNFFTGLDVLMAVLTVGVYWLTYYLMKRKTL